MRDSPQFKDFPRPPLAVSAFPEFPFSLLIQIQKLQNSLCVLQKQLFSPPCCMTCIFIFTMLSQQPCRCCQAILFITNNEFRNVHFFIYFLISFILPTFLRPSFPCRGCCLGSRGALHLAVRVCVCACLWTVGQRQRTQREPTQGEGAN